MTNALNELDQSIAKILAAVGRFREIQTDAIRREPDVFEGVKCIDFIDCFVESSMKDIQKELR